MSTNLSKEPAILNLKEIQEILPHRYPFLFVDRVIELDLENDHITAIKCVTMNEQFFQGHFPEAPIMPGVLILEAMAQTGGILIHKKGFKEKTAVLLSISRVKFRRPALPGDLITLHVQGIHLSSKGGKVSARATINDQLVAEAEIGFALRRFDQI
ncbi:MAG: 3-hydroxyacyl-[acyl-carrier-protein] dehydratase FabZ [Chlamydiae bacterium]|nr:3-hydroxyacyl-[acyl-carrier-protein] dehydratase FabZ [Chlamydiota bacterium]